MKKLLFALLISVFLVGTAFAGEGHVSINKVFDAVAITKNTSVRSQIIDLAQFAAAGYFSLQITLAGSGTGKFTYEMSNDGTTFNVPVNKAGTAVDDIYTALTAGDVIVGFSPPMARYIRIICTETLDANSITATAWLAVQ